jgi:hypothetical protein
MSAREYRARADALDRLADDAASYDVILQCQATALQWRKLADLADWQDTVTFVLALARTSA